MSTSGLLRPSLTYILRNGEKDSVALMDGDFEVPDSFKPHNNRFASGLGGFWAPGASRQTALRKDGIGEISQ